MAKAQSGKTPMKDDTPMFLIRSMSTTDANRDKPVTPYHLYLMRPEKRVGAYWSTSKLDAIAFDTIEAALEHGNAIYEGDRYDVVPRDDSQVPTYWDVRKPDYRSRVVGTEVVVDLSRPKPLSMAG